MSPVIIKAGDPLQEAARNLIRSVYRKRYDAVVRDFPELMIALLDEAGAPVCVAGLRLGLVDCFSEVYVDEPLERMLSRTLRKPVTRGEILEVTGLVSTRAGASFPLLQKIVEYGRARGMRWGVFTATGRLRRLIRTTRLPMIELAPATRERVANPEDWGSYY